MNIPLDLAGMISWIVLAYISNAIIPRFGDKLKSNLKDKLSNINLEDLLSKDGLRIFDLCLAHCGDGGIVQPSGRRIF